MQLTPSQAHHQQLDSQLVTVAKEIKILSSIAISRETQQEFLDSVTANNPIIPTIPKPNINFTAHYDEITKIIAECDSSDPIGAYIAKTAHSYQEAIQLVTAATTPDFLNHSYLLYGHPSDKIKSRNQTILQVADQFLTQIEPFVKNARTQAEETKITPTALALAIQAQADQTLGPNTVEVVCDPTLSSKATAGATRIRIRSHASFSKYDLPQLINHELLVHTLTAQNGRNQPHLQSMSLGAPRTTETQEGIAVFSELITKSMDIMRLRRITLRVHAINMGINGANFIEVFNFFKANGYDTLESANSAFRVFRGGDPHGGTVFTKDLIYLGGLLSVQDYITKSVASGNANSIPLLLSGRLATEDCESLAEAYAQKFILPPKFQPEWAKDFSTLAPQLIFSPTAIQPT